MNRITKTLTNATLALCLGAVGFYYFHTANQKAHESSIVMYEKASRIAAGPDEDLSPEDFYNFMKDLRIENMPQINEKSRISRSINSSFGRSTIEILVDGQVIGTTNTEALQRYIDRKSTGN